MAKKIAPRKPKSVAASKRPPHTGMEEVLERSGEELRLITEPLGMAIAYVNVEQRYVFTNKAYEEWVDRSRQEIEGRHIREVLGEAVYEKIRGHLEAALSGELVTFEDILPYRERGLRHVAVTYRPYLGKMRNVEGFIALINDISELKQAEEAIQRLREELEEKVEAEMLRGNTYGLTFREFTVLHLLASGHEDKEIAVELGISPHTASKHVKNIKDKMKAATRTEAGVRAVREKLID